MADKHEVAFTFALLQPQWEDVDETAQLTTAIDNACKGHCTRVVINALVLVMAGFVTRLPASCWKIMCTAVAQHLYETTLLGE